MKNRSNFSPQAFAINQSHTDKSCLMTNAKTAAGSGDPGGHAAKTAESLGAS